MSGCTWNPACQPCLPPLSLQHLDHVYPTHPLTHLSPDSLAQLLKAGEVEISSQQGVFNPKLLLKIPGPLYKFLQGSDSSSATRASLELRKNKSSLILASLVFLALSAVRVTHLPPGCVMTSQGRARADLTCSLWPCRRWSPWPWNVTTSRSQPCPRL